MSCSGCADLSAELSSQKAFFAQWFESLQEKLHSMDMKFEEANQKSMEFRKEIFVKLDALRSDVITNVEKSGWSNNSAFLTHESGPSDEIQERENLSGSLQSDDGLVDNSAPTADISMLNESEKVYSPTLALHQKKDTPKYRLPMRGMKKLPPMLRNRRIVRVIRVQRPEKKSARATIPQTGTKDLISRSFYEGETRFVGCALCETPIVARTRNKLRHAMLHLDENAFQCSNCDKKFKRREYAIEHAERVHSEVDYPKDLIVWTIDQEDHKKNVASKVAQCFPSKTSLTPPNKKSARAMEQTICDSETTAVCTLCGTLMAASNLNKSRHALIHLDEKAFQCSMCDRRFTRRDGAIEHVQNVHSETRNSRDLVVWAVDQEDHEKKLASKIAECFPNEASSS